MKKTCFLKKLKRIICSTLAVVTVAGCMTAASSPVMGANVSFPSLKTSAYCEFIAPKTIKVYKDANTTTQGTKSPAKAYNAFIEMNDECHIFEISSKSILLDYPTSQGRRTGYIKIKDLLSVTSPLSVDTANGKATTYRYPGGKEYGYTEKSDKVYNCGNTADGKYTLIVYTAKSGNRAYKLGYVLTTDYNRITGRTAETKSKTVSPVPSGCKFNTKTKDWDGFTCYHDINRGVSTSTPVYAIADGTATYYQAYSVGKNGKYYLTSYGNHIRFTSNDGTYQALYAHLSRFNGVSERISSSDTLQQSGSSGKYTLATKSVKAGDILGYIGKTGNASGVHLHFELYKIEKNDKTRIDPTTIFPELKP